MGSVLGKFQDYQSVAFAHTISGDFGHPRQMSAGVAVVFKGHLGKPKYSDCVNGNLTFQKIEAGAAVYSLVTKAHYWGKPTSEKYDKAFEELTEDFLNRNLKRLFWSPMGCVRDSVPINHFASKIVEFQQRQEILSALSVVMRALKLNWRTDWHTESFSISCVGQQYRIL